MNERIRELAMLAVEDAAKYCQRRFDLDREENETFALSLAELIVQKCVTIVALHGISNFENEDISWVCDKIVKEINEQFGVES
jgi:hypothetical protein